MKLELVQDLPPDEIKNIWFTYLEEKARIAGMLTSDEFNRLIKRTKEFTTVSKYIYIYRIIIENKFIKICF
jgi:hypothetical protein